MPETFEVWRPVPEDDPFAIEEGFAGWQRRERLDDLGERARGVPTATVPQRDGPLVLRGKDPEAVVLQFEQQPGAENGSARDASASSDSETRGPRQTGSGTHRLDPRFLAADSARTDTAQR